MGRQPVKNNLIMTLEVIKRHSDVDHRLTQKNIQEYLQTDFELTCDRKNCKAKSYEFDRVWVRY